MGLLNAAVSAVLLALVVYQFTGYGRNPSTPDFCLPEEDDVLCSFSESYWEARSKFRRATALYGGKLHTLEVAEGHYTIDVAVFRGQGDGLVIHSSGVHGVEGYAGSGVQLRLIPRLSVALSGSKAPTVILIHAVNPFGMAHFRRWNENNVSALSG